MSSVPLGFVSKQAGCQETGPWADQGTRGRALLGLSALVSGLTKYDLHLFYVLPGAPAVVLSCLVQALIVPILLD